ncbi:hypothetical protein QBC47DRAFT_458289 [Echria macrotheca]|uniref:Uncharacterized protein n=1 Tax=Echria macrotheca TaxID=438768 RepID=A0AAJ0F8L3_9PEZI|nr:hypothetical protein QBC47DRAFT_458289 [Echria macrotheca]
MTATYTPLTAMTTPFVRPASCASIFTSTSVVDYIINTDSYGYGYTTESSGPLTTLPILVSNTADARFSACQPTGWDRGNVHFSFRPAVCPSGWIMYNAAALDQYGDHRSSSAYCCASGYTLNSAYHLLGSSTPTGLRCLSSMPGGPTPTGPATTSATTTSPPTSSTTETTTTSDDLAFTTTSTILYNTLYPAGIALHDPYLIEWHTTDLPSLSPAPPSPLPCDATLATWTPGSPVPTLNCSSSFESDLHSHGSEWGPGTTAVIWFCAIGLPLLFFFAVLACVGCYCRSKVRERDERRQKEVVKAIEGGMVVYRSLEEGNAALLAARAGTHGGGVGGGEKVDRGVDGGGQGGTAQHGGVGGGGTTRAGGTETSGTEGTTRGEGAAGTV